MPSYLNQKLNKSESGFTLTEALVALVILTIAILPALYTSQLAVNISASIRNSLVAANLSQEGIEVIRAMRDANWLNSVPFDQGLVGTWRVEWNSDTPIDTSGSGNPNLKINNGIYNYTPSGTDTPFKRTITVTKINSGDLRLVVNVSWTERGRDKSVQLESHLFDWK